jgi:hypothetical protein
MNKLKNPLAKSMSEGEEEELCVSALVDPVFVLVRSKVGVSLVVALPLSFDATRSGSVRKDIDMVTEAELSAATTMIHARVLEAKLQGPVDDENSSIIFRQSSLSGQLLKAKGWFVRACSPSLASDESGAPVWTLPVFSLTMLLELHYLDVTGEQAHEIPIIELGSLYRSMLGEAVFIASGTERVPGEEGEALVQQARAADVSCPLCCLKVPAKMLHNHMGAHILLEPNWSKYGKAKPVMPCGLCGVRDAIMCKTPIASEQVIGCPISAVKPRGASVLKPMHQCKLLSGYDCEYSMTSRASSVASSPCTNRPVTCPICGLYGWSYNMEVHVASGSCAAARGGAVVASYVPAHHEREWLEPFLKASKSKLKACAVAGCACKRTTPKGKGRAPPGV